MNYSVSSAITLPATPITMEAIPKRNIYNLAKTSKFKLLKKLCTTVKAPIIIKTSAIDKIKIFPLVVIQNNGNNPINNLPPKKQYLFTHKNNKINNQVIIYSR